MGLTNFPNGVSSFGVPQVGSGDIFSTFGSVFWVDADSGSDSNDGTEPTRAKKTVAAGYALMTTNKNDILCMSANAAHALTAMLTVAKNRCHFIGLDGGGRRIDQRCRWELAVGTDALDLATLNVTGTGCSFRNIKFVNTNTLSNSKYGVIAGGEDTLWANCTFNQNAQQGVATSADLLLQSCNDRFIDCTIGNNSLKASSTSTNMLLNDGVGNFTASRNNRFDNCDFASWGAAANTAINIVAENDLYGVLTLKDCEFTRKVAEGQAIGTVAIDSPQTTFIEGDLFIINPALLNYSGICADTTNNLGIWVSGPAPSATSGRSILGSTS